VVDGNLFLLSEHFIWVCL